MKTEIMQKIIEKQDELINVYANYIIGNEIEGYTWESDFQKPANTLLDELASLKSQLAEAGEEDVYTKSLRLLTEFMDKTPSEEIAVELRKIANKAGEENEEKQEEEQTCHNCKFAGTLGEPCDICMIDGNDMWQPC